MTITMLIAVAGVYLWVAVEQTIKGNAGMGVAYLGYALANIGMCFLAK